VTPIDQDTIVRVTINGKKPVIHQKGFFLLKLLQKTLLPHGENEKFPYLKRGKSIAT
jgi:hypothetical protein